MASPYRTRSTSATASASMTTDSSATAVPVRFCVVLTNNPRMVQAAQRKLQNVILNDPNEPARREQQPPMPLMTSTPKTPRRSRSSLQLEQQVPAPELPATTPITAAVLASQMRAYEKEIEDDFRVQVQPFLQIYLQKTRWAIPINSILDMSNLVRF